jgi:hypothetical protein
MTTSGTVDFLAAITDRIGARGARQYVRPHNFVTLFGDSLRLYRDNWLALIGIYLVPAFALSLLFNRLDSSSEIQDPLILSLAYLKLTILLLGPLTAATSEACLGWPMGVVRAYRRAGGMMLLRLVAAALLWMTLTLSGFAAVYLALHDFDWIDDLSMPVQIAAAFAVAVIPMLIFGARYMFVQQTIMLEHCGLFPAFRRSSQLACGYSSRNLLYVLSVAAILVVIVTCGNYVLSGFALPGGTPKWLAEVAVVLVSSAPSVIVMPILSIALVLLYYDLRVRKDHYDLEQLEQELHG